jgi:hypothetical protein
LNVPAGGTGSAMGKITLAAAVNTINVQTDITTSADARYSITLSSATQVYNLVPYTSTGTYGSTYYTYNGVEIPADAYSITLNVSAGTAAVTATSITLGRYDWNLFSVNTTQDPPTKISLVSGEGQANTPISYDGSGNIYWGVWGGTHTYYQYNTSTQALAQFKPTVTGTASGFDDFYNTGAAIIAPTGSTQYVVFGSDSGTVYIRPTGSTFATATGNSFQIPSAAGMIRSSVAAKGSYVYFTSRIADSTTSTYTGRLYRADASSIIPGQTPSYTYVPLSYASTSTPVISDNNYVYVGTYNGFTSGTVEAILYSNIAPSATMVPIYPESGTGAPVQSSPIVWSDATDDYVYFTTNSSSGAGYCYYIDTTASPLSASEEWTAPNTSGNNYSLQGMAYSDIGGYVVWGDDGNNLYIAP